MLWSAAAIKLFGMVLCRDLKNCGSLQEFIENYGSLQELWVSAGIT